MTTIHQQWLAIHNVKCNCNNENIVVYYCQEKTCNENAQQKFFCMDCAAVFKKHQHDRISIKDELKRRCQEWQLLDEKV